MLIAQVFKSNRALQREFALIENTFNKETKPCPTTSHRNRPNRTGERASAHRCKAANYALRPIRRPRKENVFDNTVNALHLRVGSQCQQPVDLSQSGFAGFVHKSKSFPHLFFVWCREYYNATRAEKQVPDL